MPHRIETSIEIDAAPAVVWDILTDLPGYASWNPFIVASEGQVQVGQRLQNRMRSGKGKDMTFKPQVTVVEPERVFEWLGRLGLPGLFDGRHRFQLEATAEGNTKLVHSEEFRGVLVPLFRKKLDNETRQSFIAMNEALKTAAE